MTIVQGALLIAIGPLREWCYYGTDCGTFDLLQVDLTDYTGNGAQAGSNITNLLFMQPPIREKGINSESQRVMPSGAGLWLSVGRAVAVSIPTFLLDVKRVVPAIVRHA